MKSLVPAISISALLLSLGQGAPALDAEALRFFENEVRPLLAEHCYQCHGEEKQKGGLRMDSLTHILKGGDSGASIVLGDPEQSLVVEAVRRSDPDFAMPPKEELSAKQVEVLERWIAQGAPWPDLDPKLVVDENGFTAEEKEWWAIQPVQDPQVPGLDPKWARNEVDAFVGRKLKQEGMTPASEADRRELVRRAYLDLHGVAPTPEQTNAFVQDNRPDAWERLIDDLLSSPRYGERWGQHWLDVVRFAESDGYRQDAFRPEAWPYRDYVVRSFNEDKPYNQFVREQLAGDQINPDDPNVLVGTAYLRNGLYEYNQRNVRMHWELIVNEITNLTGEVFLGVGIGCAQCHNHKFDPLLQADYFRMQAFLAPIRWRHDLKLATPEEQKDYDTKLAAWEEATKDIRAEIDKIIEPKIQSKMNSTRKMFPEDIQKMFAKAKEDRTPYEQQLVELAEIQVDYERERFDEKKSVKGDDATKLEELKAQLAVYDNLKPKPLTDAFVATDIGPEAPEVWLTSRSGKTEIEPGYLSILDASKASIPDPGQEDSTGRRLALANWIVNPENPLSTRVIVNRIWQYHFGQGIVPTPNDFGTLGEEPSHPELLDWLTSRFLEEGWRMKEMHRLIMNSATYRQTARREPEEKHLLNDPDNRLLWRYPPQRLDAEQVRDSMLLVSGELNDKASGPSVSGTTPSRSIYVKKIRNTPDNMLRGFDAPMGFDSSPTRDATTTALQSLLLVNGTWAVDRAEAFAKKLLAGRMEINSQVIRDAYAWAYSREPSSEEMAAAEAFLNAQMDVSGAIEPEPKYPGENGLRSISQHFSKVEGLDLGNSALWLQPGSRFERLQVPGEGLDMDDFTVEAIANLDGLYQDADVRTLAARWNGSQQSRGWTFGVTSQKSRYDPQNFIMQLIGEDFQGNTVYEVVHSDLRFPLGAPVYIAAVVSTEPTKEHKTGGTVTFYMKDLSDPKAKLEQRTVNHPIVQGLQLKSQKLIVGGRGQAGRSMWDGQLARFSVSAGALSTDQLLIGNEAATATRVVDLQFNDLVGSQPIAGAQWVWGPANGDSPSKLMSAMTDFCHALLSSNEFLYLH